MNNTVDIFNIDSHLEISLICDSYRIMDNTVDFVVFNDIDSLDNFIDSSNNNKIAIIRLWFIDKYPIEQLIKSILPHCSYVILFLPEGEEDLINIIARIYCPKLIIFFCGICDSILKTTPYMEWFFRTLHQPNIDNLSLLTPFDVKPKYFDILLGRKTSTRTAVFDYVTNNNYTDKNIMTYMHTFDGVMDIFDRDTTSFILPEGATQIAYTYKSSVNVLYNGFQVHLCCIIPISIYNQTAYSFVVETKRRGNDVCFFTEKIAKPMLAKRLFLVFSLSKYLQNLRKLGFKTFDGIIDESYDIEEDANVRLNMILEQLEYLMSQPQHEIFEKIKPIVEHNQQHMLNFTREQGLVGISTYIQKTINHQTI